jgi:hypothetical protein
MPDQTDKNPGVDPVVSKEDFLEYFQTFFEWSISQAPDNAFDLQRKYFAEKYPDPTERHLKAERILAAAKYLRENLDSFDYGRTAVVGRQEAMVSKTLIWALHCVFAHPSKQCLQNPPPVALVQEIIREINPDSN